MACVHRRANCEAEFRGSRREAKVPGLRDPNGPSLQEKTLISKNTICLWYDGGALEAARRNG